MLLPEGLRFADRSRFDFSYAFFLPWKDAMAPALRDLDAEVLCLGGRNNLEILLSARRLAGHLRHARIDVLHCHLPIAGAVGRIAGRLAGTPVVYTEHNKQERYHVLTRRLNAATWRMQAAAIAVSRDVAASIESNIGTKLPVHVVLNGVDVGRFDRSSSGVSDIRRRLDIPEDAPVVGTIAVFRVQKRLEDWLAAAAIIRRREPRTRFLLIGDGPLRETVDNEIRRHGLDDCVHLPGLQEDVRPYLAAMDVYMMSSIFEGLPIALLEAMSMECAPVCTAVGGIPELIDDGKNGLLTVAGEPEELASAVCSLLSDSDRRGRLSSEARKTVEAGFSMRRMARELEAIYLQICDPARTDTVLVQADS